MEVKPTTYHSSAIENLEYIESVIDYLVSHLSQDVKLNIDRDDLYSAIAWLAEDLGYIYSDGGYMKKEDYLKEIK
tara:strand:+ start:588 stop:812 length:225 start_codon:yes stop_codon:yes gene_type:complete